MRKTVGKVYPQESTPYNCNFFENPQMKYFFRGIIATSSIKFNNKLYVKNSYIESCRVKHMLGTLS